MRNLTPKIQKAWADANAKRYSIEVWDIQFYMVDDEGNELLDEDGNVKLFDAPDFDCSHLTEGMDDCDLRLVEVKQ